MDIGIEMNFSQKKRQRRNLPAFFISLFTPFTIVSIYGTLFGGL
jgi:hypothetical protein